MSGLWYFFCAQVYFSEHLVFLRQRFSSYDELWEKLTQAEWCTNHKYSKSWHRILHVRSKQKEYQALLQRHQDQGIVVIDIENDLYPPLLKEIYHAPLMICALGNRNILQNTCVAIVGTRKATEYGLAITDEIVRILASHKITLISGMAYGIDSQVHMSAEKYNASSVAVVPASLLDSNLGGNNRLRKSLSPDQHLIVSENTRIGDLQKFHFVQRNRIIAGLSKWTIVVEAPEKSGALITAAFARDENREVFVVPHSLNNIQGRGCLCLIRDGAQIITDVDELPGLLGLTPNKVTKLPLHYQYDSEMEKLVHEKIQAGKNLDDICQELQISSTDLLVVITDLTFKKYITSTTEGVY
ncbi:MAG: hypothetical protein A2V81_05270 [Candidatus Abawacabacteria bacterium RBG_16_42_10]|uniref:Smf/DprA SLOG domain-containing protein n=1 Tax=Candidatus Abawacabacteria bacterium RBG_16_42_10 TaxID=1817814 RepID=A0A1F4XIY0_9BACT|nr:MAG: hypothetical protein A2V81_05270 [Candidatus Abawacabacteria bacterium RBG_16_42_10]